MIIVVEIDHAPGPPGPVFSFSVPAVCFTRLIERGINPGVLKNV